MSNKKTQSLNPIADGQGKDTQLTINCTLIGGVLPMFEIFYQNRKITGFFNRSIWNNEKAITELAKNVIDARHEVEPFNCFDQ